MLKFARISFAPRSISISPCTHLTRVQRAASNNRKKVETIEMAYTAYDEHCLPMSTSTIPVVISHGLFGSRNNWHSLAKVINKMTKRKIYAVDLRCHGDSPHHPEINYNLLSEDIIHFVTEKLRLSKVSYLGHSLGGATMLEASIKKPDIVESMTSADMSLARFAKPDEGMKYLDAMISARWNPEASLSTVRKTVDVHLEQTIELSSLRQWLLMNLVQDGNTVRWRLDLQSLKNNFHNLFRKSELTGEYSGPTLYVSGSDSRFVRNEHHDIIRHQFPQARFVSIPGAGHWLHSEKPQEFVEIVSEFLNELPRK